MCTIAVLACDSTLFSVLSLCGCASLCSVVRTQHQRGGARGWTSWFSQPLYYQVAAAATLTRLIANVSQVSGSAVLPFLDECNNIEWRCFPLQRRYLERGTACSRRATRKRKASIKILVRVARGLQALSGGVVSSPGFKFTARRLRGPLTADVKIQGSTCCSLWSCC